MALKEDTLRNSLATLRLQDTCLDQEPKASSHLDEKINLVGAQQLAALPLHAERVQVLFTQFLWQKHGPQVEKLKVNVLVMTADMAPKMWAGSQRHGGSRCWRVTKLRIPL